MSLPAADLPAPLAVLVLAWDEAAPAVRALVAATQAHAPTVDSILVMVPQADAPDHFSAEEYLALAPPDLENRAPEAAPALAEPVLPLAEASSPAPAAATSLLRAETVAEDGEPTIDAPLLPAPPVAAPTAAAEGWAAVRVLRLGSHSLPQLSRLAGRPLPAPIWLGPAALPAAPYLGAALPAPPETLEPALLLGPTLAADQPEASIVVTLAEASLPAVSTAAASEQPIDELLPAVAPADWAEPLLQDAALETDLPPSEPDELEAIELASPDLAPLEDAALMPEQAGWPEALAALRQPAPTLSPEPPTAPPAEPTPADETDTTLALGALHPPTQHYSAPNLNFQIIQYARFAVPVALAEPAYEVIYAPAWPTWLAAQELRQRTGRPLVLHVATLAAAANESAETATGWVAELQRQGLRRADLVLTETAALAERLHHELGLAAGTVRVIAAANVEAIAQALHEARPRPA